MGVDLGNRGAIAIHSNLETSATVKNTEGADPRSFSLTGSPASHAYGF